jgi:hypothetical protein
LSNQKDSRTKISPKIVSVALALSVILSLSIFNYVPAILQTFLVCVLVGGTIALLMLGVFYLIRSVSRPLANRISKFVLVNEKKSVSRLLPESESLAIHNAKSEEELVQLMKNVAVKNGWNTEDVARMPVWWLTGHIVQDASPNFWPITS